MIIRILGVGGLFLSLLGGPRATADDGAFSLRADTGLPTAGPTFGGTWADLDDDGHWDLVLSRHADEHVEVFLGRGDLTFTGPAAFAMPPGLLDHHGTAACDHDGDGRWDLYLSAGADRGHGRSCKQLWRATAALAFVNDAPCGHLLADSVGRGRGALWLRLSDDPLPQLLVLNYASPARPFGRVGSRWQDLASWFLPTGPLDAHTAEADDLDGDGRLDLITCGTERRCWRHDGQRLVAAPGAFPSPIPAVNDLATGDVDGDGDADLLLALRGGALRLLVNESTADSLRFAGPRVDAGLPRIAEPVSVDLADLDNDGMLDLVVAQRENQGGRPPLVARGRGDGTFEPAFALTASRSRAMAIWAIDLDRDGDLDLVAFNGEETSGRPRGGVLLYENHTTSPGVTVELASAPGGAPHGLGAVVEVQVGGRVVRRLVRSTANPWNSTVLPVHVGTGDHDGPLLVTVTWPGGQRQQLELPQTRAAYRIDHRRATPQRL